MISEENMQFEFVTAGRIIFGSGKIQEIGALTLQLGKRAFISAGKNLPQAQLVCDLLAKQHIRAEIFPVECEPNTAMILQAVQRARRLRSNLVIAVGGGSVIDTGKVVAAMLTNKGELLDYLEVIGRGGKLVKRAVPCIAIPTTAGTGAEVTRNAVIASTEHKVKVSIRSPYLLPQIALVDPELTVSMPPEVTAGTGLDALTQLLEAFVTHKANPFTDGLCREGLERAARSLRQAFHHGQDLAAREDMCIASLFSGMALANAGLGAVHGFAGPLGGLFNAPHGVICARLLPFVMEANVRTLFANQPRSVSLSRYEQVAQILTGDAQAGAAAGVQWVKQVCAELNVAPLSFYGMQESDIPTVVEKAQQASSMKGNPVELDTETLAEILHKAL